MTDARPPSRLHARPRRRGKGKDGGGKDVGEFVYLSIILSASSIDKLLLTLSSLLLL